MSITLITADTDSITISWPEVPGATGYILQYRKATATTTDDDFETLSENLASTQARKKNLTNDDSASGFFFRVKDNSKDSSSTSWISHTDPFHLLSPEQEKNRLAPPTVTHAGSNHAGLVSWKATTTEKIKGYELQMRESVGGAEWKTIAPCLSGTEVRKKNLTSKHGYQFRVRSVGADDGDQESRPFSAPSDNFIALGLGEGIRKFFSNVGVESLLKSAKEAPIPLADALGGKEFVLLYASAHWCGPCRKFSPKLAQWYQTMGANKLVDVVFLSADHDENGFKSYYSSMPWLAVDYDHDGREQLMGQLRITGIPRLAVVDARTGRIIEENAVGKPLDVNRWRKLAAAGSS